MKKTIFKILFVAAFMMVAIALHNRKLECLI